MTTDKVIAAAPGTEIVTLATFHERPTLEDQVLVSRYPVVAWRIARDDVAHPVLLMRPSAGEFVLHPLPDGRFLCPKLGREFLDLDSAKAGILVAAVDAFRLAPYADDEP